MNKITIDKLEDRARLMGQYYCAWRKGVGDWVGYTVEEDLVPEILEGGNAIKFKRASNHQASITFNNLQMKNIQPGKTRLHTPTVSSSENTDAQSTIIRNNSDLTVSREYCFDMSEESTQGMELGVAMTTGLSQTISYGGEMSPVAGETSFELSIETSFGVSKESSQGTSRTTTTSIEVPPHTEATITTSRAVSVMNQKIEAWCDLEHGIIFDSSGEWADVYESVERLRACLCGLGRSDEGHIANWINSIPGRFTQEVWRANIVCQPLDLHYENTIRFENATTGNVEVTSRAI